MADEPRVTLADLQKPGLWKFTGHADGGDKHGQFSINFYECEIAGVTVRGFKKTWSNGAGAAGYAIAGEPIPTLALVVEALNQRFTAGDAPEARDD